MKARTKEQKKILSLSKKLKPISESAKEYAYKHCFPNVGLYWKRGEVWCQCCGHRSHLDASELGVVVGVYDNYVCPECGRKLKLEYYRGKQTNVSRYFTLFQVYKEYQVIRTFEVSRRNGGNKHTDYGCVELWQNWIGKKGKETVIGLDYKRSMYHFSWVYNGEMNVKMHNGGASGYISYEDVFDITGNMFYSRGGVTKLLKRNGWSMDILKEKEIEVIPLMKSLIKMDDAFVEELVKHKQYGILSFCQHAGGHWKDRTQWQHAIRICERNKYIVDDGSLYMDYLELLRYFLLDTHNAKYVCPGNLREEHDRLLNRKNKVEAKKKLEEEMKQARMFEEQYRERMKAFFGLSFGSEDIRISPLKSVEEFAEEGRAMHHCVYAMGYYDGKRHPDSLIMSAKDKEGNRLETIEVDTKLWKIIQSRGVCNQNSPRHEDIVRLVTNYMPLLRKTAYTVK